MAPDTPEVEQPWPELQALGAKIARLLPDLDVTMPILVNGDWGSGKTTLLEILRQELQNREPGAASPRGGSAVLFEAWSSEAESQLLPAMIRAVWEGLGARLKTDQQTRAHHEALWTNVYTAAKTVAPSLVQLAGVPVLGSVVSAAIALSNRERTPAPSESAPKALEPSPSEELWTRLEAFVRSLPALEQPLVILIDDLDRCSPSGAVALLDALRMLVVHADRMAKAESALPLRFVVALDRTVIAQAVVRKYHDIGHFDGHRYLEKIFPLTFDLPRPNVVAVRSLVNRAFEGDALPALCESVLSDQAFANPRLIKRCVNRLKLLMHFEGVPGELAPADVAALEGVVLWLAATERWPALRRLLKSRSAKDWSLLQQQVGQGPSPELAATALRELADEPDLKHWLKGLRNETLLGFHEADERLRKHGL